MIEKPIKTLYLITGTTRGIGRALLTKALQQPDTFVVSLSSETSRCEGNHQNICVDLGDTPNIASRFDAVRLDPGLLKSLETTVLINNAGVLEPISPLWDCQDGLLTRNLHVNLLAPLILSRHFYHFAKPFPGKKWIVNIGSGASRTPYYGWAAYGASKAGLDMATRAMAMEFSGTGSNFHVCSVAPGTVDTRMQDNIRACSPDRFEQVQKFIQLKESGALFSPEWTAAKLIRCLMEGRFENGGRYDLREMTP